MNADGSGQRNLTRNAANDYLYGYGANPWSPDGRKIVFGRDRDGDGAATTSTSSTPTAAGNGN